MSRRTRNLLIVTVVAAGVGLVSARAMIPTATPAATVSAVDLADDLGATSWSRELAPTPSPSAVGLYSAVTRMREVEYAVALHELRGLPPDAGTGSVLDLWVAWDDAYSQGPQIQRLVRSVTLTRFIEPVTLEGPVVVVLSVPEKSVGRLMYGDLYGSLSATVPSG